MKYFLRCQCRPAHLAFFLIILFTLIPISTQVQASDENMRWWHPFSFSVGNFSPYAGGVQENEKGSTNSLEWHPFIDLAYQVPLGAGGWTLMPAVGMAAPSHGRDDHLTKTLSFTHLLIATPVKVFAGNPAPPGSEAKGSSSGLRFKAGVGVIMTRISGKGGQVIMRNGGGSSTFFLPSQSSTAVNTALELGPELFLGRRLSMEVLLFSHALLESASRQFSYSLSFNFYLEDKL